MRRDIAIGMAGQARFPWPLQSSQVQLATGVKGVHVDAYAD
jgi:hypothetical protein